MEENFHDTFYERKTEIIGKFNQETKSKSIYPSYQKMVEYSLNLRWQQHYLKSFEITDSFPFPFLLVT